MGRHAKSVHRTGVRRADAPDNPAPRRSGRLKPAAVLTFGIVLAVTGSIYLAITANLLASLLAILTLLTYLFMYTPLKRKRRSAFSLELFQVLCPAHAGPHIWPIE